MSKSRIEFPHDDERCPRGRRCDSYAATPTCLRLYRDEWEFVGDSRWVVDGVDDLGHYTEEIETYNTFSEAVADLPYAAYALGLRGI